jgi:hypothetical protein
MNLIYPLSLSLYIYRLRVKSHLMYSIVFASLLFSYVHNARLLKISLLLWLEVGFF